MTTAVTTLDPEIKEEWVRRLRSGEYTQTKGQLNNAEGFCCLGVLCEIAVEQGVIQPAREMLLSSRGTKSYYGPDPFDRDGERGEYLDLPVAVQKWSGVSAAGALNQSVTYTVSVPEFSDPEEYAQALSVLNDDADFTFEQIADVIEAQF